MNSLCASHISNKDRFFLFEKMLTSILYQTVKTTLHISISYAKELENDTDNFIRKWSNGQIIFYKRKCVLAQFRHYSLLLEDLQEILDPDSYILFTDDDDIWAPNRVEIYLKFIKLRYDKTFIISNCVIRGRSIENSIKIEDKDNEYISICTTLGLAMSYITTTFTRKKLESLAFDVEFYKTVSSTCSKYRLEKDEWLYFYQIDPSYEHITM
jgi:hypothetical protein